MLKKLVSTGLLVASVVLMSCGGSSNTITGPGGGGGGASTAASVQVLASSPQLPSDVNGLGTVDITAIVRDASNVVLADIPVSFGANANGSLAVVDAATDANGRALARLSNGTDLSNRAITVTVTAGTVSGSVTVNVTGTRIRLTPPTATLSLSDAVAFTAVLEDSAGLGIPGRAVAITSSAGNGLSAANLTTQANGSVQFTLTATAAGLDTLSASAIGVTAQSAVSVSGDSFSITTPTQNAEISLGAVQPITATWVISGVPQVGQTISFTSTRGTLSSSTAVTNGSGQATVTISSNSSGPALV
ncbi:MAG: Ig-like domain-containing protein, partial [Gammaproteobacteria bacterium]|nr:Ig-like domain-containing protein [Gammaproteobacteria bacterium]